MGAVPTFMCVALGSELGSRIWYSIPSSTPVTSYHMRSTGFRFLRSRPPSFLQRMASG